MKYCQVKVGFFLISVSLLFNSNIAYSGNISQMRRSNSFQQHIQAHTNNQWRARFRQIITKNIQPYVGNIGPESSPAIVVGLVTEKGDVVVGLGQRKIGKSLPPDGDTLFALGSITKVFTGLLLAQAVTNGDVKLLDKANELLPEKMHIDKAITLQQLVTHHSGLPDFPGNIAKHGSNMNRNDAMPAKDYSKTDLEECLKNDECQPQNTPGKKYLYSNLGIGILSVALQNRYGYQDFNSMNQARIINVLGMDNTSTNVAAFLEKHINNLVQDYSARNRRLEPVSFSDMGIMAGSGELISSANDMNKVLRVLTNLSSSKLSNAVKEAGRELAKTDKSNLAMAYAHGIRHLSGGDKIHFKSGLTAGSSAIMLWHDTEPKIGIIVLTNRGKFRPLKSISRQIFKIVTQQLQNQAG